MEIKDLQREIIDAERLAERTRTILSANDQLAAMKMELDAARKTIAERDATIATLTAELATVKGVSDGD